MMASFFLIQADPGRTEDLAEFVAKIPGVYNVSVTSGPYDVVVELIHVEEHQQRIRAAVRRAPGLARLCVLQGMARRPGTQAQMQISDARASTLSRH